jgi:hypothetical protein
MGGYDDAAGSSVSACMVRQTGIHFARERHEAIDQRLPAHEVATGGASSCRRPPPDPLACAGAAPLWPSPAPPGQRSSTWGRPSRTPRNHRPHTERRAGPFRSPTMLAVKPLQRRAVLSSHPGQLSGPASNARASQARQHPRMRAREQRRQSSERRTRREREVCGPSCT